MITALAQDGNHVPFNYLLPKVTWIDFALEVGELTQEISVVWHYRQIERMAIRDSWTEE